MVLWYLLGGTSFCHIVPLWPLLEVWEQVYQYYSTLLLIIIAVHVPVAEITIAVVPGLYLE